MEQPIYIDYANTRMLLCSTLEERKEGYSKSEWAKVARTPTDVSAPHSNAYELLDSLGCE
jgi:hypothetical protein